MTPLTPEELERLRNSERFFRSSPYVMSSNWGDLIQIIDAERTRAERAEAEVERFKSFCGEALCGDIERDRDLLELRLAEAVELLRYWKEPIEREWGCSETISAFLASLGEEPK